MSASKILLTTVYGPFDTFEDGSNMMDLYAGRLTKGQELFTFNSYYPALPLYLIAENISVPTVVLESPSVADLEREFAKGYDYVGIHFAASLFFDRVLKMCRMIKKISPRTKIVLGSYGVMCLSQDFEEEKELRALADYVCDGEGVRYMRELLGEPADRPMTQRFPDSYIQILGVRYHFNNLVSALGCRAGCEFCATSAFFKYKKVRLLTPAELWAHLKENVRKRHLQFTWIFDEDFFDDPEYVREFGRLVAADKEVPLGDIRWGGFGSIRTLSQFSPEELSRMGAQAIWVGIESKFSQLPKRQGKDIQEVFDGLHRAGIQTVGSFIVGWDFQTKDNIEEDIAQVVRLNPTFSQISSLMPCPGTRLWQRMEKEGRLYKDNFRWKTFHLYSAIHKHANLADDEVFRWVAHTQKELFRANGPSVLRTFEVNLNGYVSFKDSPDERLRQKAAYFAHWCREIYPALLALKTFAPTARVRAACDRLGASYRAEFGAPSPVQRIKSGLFVLVVACLKFRALFPPIPYQPPYRRFRYRGAE